MRTAAAVRNRRHLRGHVPLRGTAPIPAWFPSPLTSLAQYLSQRSAAPVWRQCLALRAWSLCLLFSCIPGANADEVLVAANPATPAANPISHNILSAVFGMRLRIWETETPIRVFVLPSDHPVHVAFCKQILGVFPHQMRTAWDRLVYSGTGQAPVEVRTEEEMRGKLASTPGAIGYLTSNMINESVTPLRLE